VPLKYKALPTCPQAADSTISSVFRQSEALPSPSPKTLLRGTPSRMLFTLAFPGLQDYNYINFIIQQHVFRLGQKTTKRIV
jgi:hypothetical protein